MKQIHLWLPRSDAKAMADGRQKELTFNTDELGFPLRITIAVPEKAPTPTQPRRPR